VSALNHFQKATGGTQMFSAIRKRITYANVAMTLALVFAMSGGAYAAGKYLITSTKQISPKVLKSLVGKTGPAGANGTNGAPGPAGEKGAQGPAGNNGSNGGEGKAGESVTTKPASEAECKEKVGGTAFTVSGKTEHVCDGKNGTTGFTKVLPKGETETGTWSFGETTAASTLYLPISLSIPLSAGLDETHVQFIGASGNTMEGCEGGTLTVPTAEPGYLCVYANQLSNATVDFFLNPGHSGVAFGAATTGTTLVVSAAAGADGYGTWAVTAPSEG
jgi:hypothetical protein